MLASINSLFNSLEWHDLKVKSLKLQQQVFCSEDRELTKAEYARLCKTAKRKKINGSILFCKRYAARVFVSVNYNI